jgi:hypothetical protein
MPEMLSSPGASFIRSKDTMGTEHQLGNHQEQAGCGDGELILSYLELILSYLDHALFGAGHSFSILRSIHFMTSLPTTKNKHEGVRTHDIIMFPRSPRTKYSMMESREGGHSPSTIHM